jgi:hypothetical protein
MVGPTGSSIDLVKARCQQWVSYVLSYCRVPTNERTDLNLGRRAFEGKNFRLKRMVADVSLEQFIKPHLQSQSYLLCPSSPWRASIWASSSLKH